MGKDDTQLIIEHFDNQFAVFLENVDTMITTKVRAIVQEEVSAELAPVKADIRTIKAVVTDTNKDLKAAQLELDNHEQRITTLEAA